ncbi:hypothetical protein SUGI_0800380 [Cryptomeria japonica]|uniref:zinc finger protein ZAT9-like n=1 Tax=Cryptomeria japonica TaxID=3369 RepID=UPI0024149DE0|nr:zinc finger protein ZAT9-like [Cryptomeria japonica]GLJ39234.1 hypothetical protein SUGI_0800380 [Cryptomeria japonica]
MSSSSVVQEFRSQDMEPPFPQFVSSIVGSMARGERSKRPRPCYSASEEDHVFWSSLSETEAEEEEEKQQLAAYSLMMIAHAHGIRSSGKVRLSGPSKRKFESLEDFEAECPEIQGIVKQESEKRYHCKTCSKKFMSFQALGGHRASCHNKTRILQGQAGGFDYENVAASPVKERLHICPICDRVFTSGQALGGHKRTHTTPSTSISHTTVAPLASSSISTTKSENQLDLNMPAPLESIDSLVAPRCSVTPLPPRFSKPNYKFNPYWWMESSARSTPSLYDGGVLVAAEDKAPRDLDFKQDLFLVATVN